MTTEFKIGDAVRKKGDKGQWHGFIVGTYSTKCTPNGYAVESVYEENSVQIYPASALEPWDIPAKAEDNKGKGDELDALDEIFNFVEFQSEGHEKRMCALADKVKAALSIPAPQVSVPDGGLHEYAGKLYSRRKLEEENATLRSREKQLMAALREKLIKRRDETARIDHKAAFNVAIMDLDKTIAQAQAQKGGE